MSVMALPAIPAEGGLTSYLQAIRKFPILTPERETELGKRLRDFGDIEAAHTLVTSHLRLVAKIAMGFRGYGLPINDLISEGNVGLMQAVKRFDPERGIRLATYAMWWIRASIQEYVLASWSLVRLGSTMAHKKMFFNLTRLKRKLQLGDERELAPEHAQSIATALELKPEDVITIDQRLNRRDVSLNLPAGENGDGQWQDFLPDGQPNQEILLGEHEEAALRRSWLEAGMKDLDARERHIVIERRLKEPAATLEQLGIVHGISRERVRQLENRAFAKLKAAVVAQAGCS